MALASKTSTATFKVLNAVLAKGPPDPMAMRPRQVPAKLKVVIMRIVLTAYDRMLSDVSARETAEMRLGPLAKLVLAALAILLVFPCLIVE